MGRRVFQADASDQDGALSLYDQLRNAGYAAQIRPVSTEAGTTYRVRISNFATREEAAAFGEKLKGKFGITAGLTDEAVDANKVANNISLKNIEVQDTVLDGIAMWGEDINEGDFIINNYAGVCGQHLNNVVMYTPVFAGGGDGLLFGFMCVLAHWIDVGGGVVGSFLSSTDMKTGSPAFGGPESAFGLYASGQIARDLDLPWRSGGGTLTSSQLPDYQAGYEAMNTLLSAFLAGANVCWQSAGWMEGGLVTCFEKFAADTEILDLLCHQFRAVELTEADLAFDAHVEAGHGGHFFGTQHTLERFRDCFWRPTIASTENNDRWLKGGSLDHAQRAARRWQEQLEQYEQPPLDAAVEAELVEFVQRRAATKIKAPDAQVLDGDALQSALEAKIGEFDELQFANAVTGWLKDEAANAEILDTATRYAAWAVHTEAGQALQLSSEILPLGRDARVANEHRPSSCRV